MSARCKKLLIQFAKSPKLGGVKTRLAKTMGAELALEVHLELMRETASLLLDSGVADAELWLDSLTPSPHIQDILALGLRGPMEQRGEDLGERMCLALQDGLLRASAVVLVGSDCPFLDERYLNDAFEALDESDLVFGPAEDGGFVLIGARQVRPAMFDGVSWGQGDVLARTLKAVERAGLSHTSLGTRFDIDLEDDLARWRVLQSGVSDAGCLRS